MAVIFNEPQTLRSSRPQKKTVSFFTQMVISTGIVKTETGANWVLFVLAVICIVASVFMYNDGVRKPPAPTPQQVVI